MFFLPILCVILGGVWTCMSAHMVIISPHGRTNKSIYCKPRFLLRNLLITKLPLFVTPVVSSMPSWLIPANYFCRANKSWESYSIVDDEVLKTYLMLPSVLKSETRNMYCTNADDDVCIFLLAHSILTFQSLFFQVVQYLVLANCSQDRWLVPASKSTHLDHWYWLSQLPHRGLSLA